MMDNSRVRKRNSTSPWNPAYPPDLTPEQYEEQVVAWLQGAGGSLENFQVEHLQHLSGTAGDYEFDAVAEFTLLHGARIVVLVECKRYSQPVEREKLLSLWAKLQDVKGNKAMMFATCGFQSGALDYAKTYGIATITFVNGLFTYETKAIGPAADNPPPSWAKIPEYAGIFITRSDDAIGCRTIDSDNSAALSEWLAKGE
jgi:restriction system protein